METIQPTRLLTLDLSHAREREKNGDFDDYRHSWESRSMRILMLSDVYFPRVNGVSTAIQTYRQQLAAIGIDSLLITPRYGNENNEHGIQRLKARPVPLDREDRFVLPAHFKRAAIDAAGQCDLIHIQTPFSAHAAGMTAARHCNLPVVSSYHTLFEEYLHHYMPVIPSAWIKSLARRISRRQCNALNAVIVPSSAMAERLRQYGVARPLHILPTGIPLERFRAGDRQRFRLQHRIEPMRPVALYVGRTAHEKNIAFLIDALRHALQDCPRLLLVIAGEGPALQSLRSKVISLGLTDSVRFVGYLDRATQLPDCYAAADAFVFASRTETQGLVLLEAMAAGLPVIALAEMGTRDILQSASGAIAPDNDERIFAQEMVRVLTDASLRNEMSLRARAWAKEWSDAALTQKLAGLYEQLLAHRIPSPPHADHAAWKTKTYGKPI